MTVRTLFPNKEAAEKWFGSLLNLNGISSGHARILLATQCDFSGIMTPLEGGGFQRHSPPHFQSPGKGVSFSET